MAIEKVTLQLKTGSIPVVLHLSQYDTDREYCFTPYYGTQIYAYQSGASVFLEATKPDHTVVEYEVTYNTDGTVSVKLSEALTQVAGDVRGKLVWTKDSLRIASAAVTFACDAAGINSYARVSESDLETLHYAESKLHNLDTYVDTAKTASATATTAATEAAESAKIAQSAESHVTAAEEKAVAAAEAAALSETHAATSESHAKASEEAAELAESHAAASEAHAAASEAKAELSESWAVGGTGKREGEDTNNSKYWCEQAQGAVAGVASFNGRTGVVTPQSGDYSYDQISNTPSAATSDTDGLMSSADKTKLDGIAEGATKVSIDSDVTEGSANAVSGGGVFTAIKAVKDSIVSTVTASIESIKTAIGDATTSARGLMTAADKTKLDGVAEGANKTTLIDNLTTTTAGVGALDAHAGYALKQELANSTGYTRVQVGSAVFKRVGHTVYMECAGIVYPTSVTIPEGYRPDEQCYVPCYVYGASVTSQYVKIGIDGTFSYEVSSLAGMPFICSAVWHVTG